MPLVRARLPWLAVFWLACQFTALTAAPVVFATTAALAADQACECPDAKPGRACPMHQAAAVPSDWNGCHMRGGCAPVDVALLTLVGGVGVLSRPLPATVETLAVSFGPLGLNPVTRAEIPEAPPPRA